MHQILQIQVHEPLDDGVAVDARSPLRFQAEDGSFYVSPREAELGRELGIGFSVLRRIPEAELAVRFHLPHHGAVLDPPPASARLAVLARLCAEGRADGSVDVRFLGRNRSVPPEAFVLDEAGGLRGYVWEVVPADEREPRDQLAERFRALLELFASPDTRVVLGLGSGGLKLFAHAPALRLLERIGLGEHIEEIWGSSAGAIAGLCYSHGFSPQALEQSGYDLYSGRYRLALRPTTLQILTHVLRDALIPPSGAAGAGFVDCASGLERMLDQYGAADGRPGRPFYCSAYNLSECRPEVLTPEPVPPHLESMMAQTDAREAAMASSSVPLLFVPRLVRRGERRVPYIDGSMIEDIPLYSAVRKWDLDREAGVETRSRLVVLYVKLTGGIKPWGERSDQIGKLQLLQTVAAAGTDIIHQRDLALLKARGDVELLGLDLGEFGADFFETRRIPEFIRAAKERFPAQLAAIERRLRR